MKKIGLVLALGVSFLAARAVEPELWRRYAHSDQCVRWVDSVMSTLGREARVGQLFMPVVSSRGTVWNEKMTDWVCNQGIGGLYFDRGTLNDQVSACLRAQSVAKVPLLIGADAEWGLAMRLDNCLTYPHNTTLGAVADSQLIYEYGREMARQCRQVGIQVSFAPVADINNNPENPIINTRSFGSDPARVASYAGLYAKGLEDGGVLAVMKHFPGHGNTMEDSHEQLAVVHNSREGMDTVELLPFRHLIEQGISGVMVGHLSVPAIDAQTRLPSSQSKTVVDGLLRSELGFEGLAITDAMAMKGSASSYSGMNCIRALLAGNDILLNPASLVADMKAVIGAVEKGILSDSLIDAKCRKVLTYKYILGLDKPYRIDRDRLADSLFSSQAVLLDDELYRQSITLLRNYKDFMPLHHLDSEKTAVVLVGAKADDNPFVETLRLYQENLPVIPLTDFASVAVYRDSLRTFDRLLVGVYSNNQLCRTLLAQLEGLERSCLCFFTSPYTLSSYGDVLVKARAVMLAYEIDERAQRAAAQAIMGGRPVTGRLPAPIGGYYAAGTGLKTEKTRLAYGLPEEVGMDSEKLARLDYAVEEAIGLKAFPGCQVLVARRGVVVWNKAYGWTDVDRYTPVTTEHVYDLASVTKALVTTPLVMSLCEHGKVALDDPVSKHLPALRETDKENLSYRQMLYHEARLSSFVPFYQSLIDTASYDCERFLSYRPDSVHTLQFDQSAYAPSHYSFYPDMVSPTGKEPFRLQVASDLYVNESFRDSVTAIICRSDLLKRTRYTYSDLGFILMGFAAETILDKTLDKWADEELFRPLGAYTTGYLPLNRLPLERIVPTALDTALRHQLIHGYPHDEAAAFLGGVSGNAGVFSNANDLAKYLQMLLDGGAYGDQRYFEPSTIRFFTSTRSRLSRRMLGFDAYEPNASRTQTVSHYCSPRTYGHTGFTGTCFWVDPDNELIYIFLSNRVHPDRTNNLLSKLDIRIHLQDIIYQSFICDEK